MFPMMNMQGRDKSHDPKQPTDNIRLLVCGSREWTEEEPIIKLYQNISFMVKVDKLIHGMARGADKLSEKVAVERFGMDTTDILRFPALWTRYGRGAGPIRNTQMLEEEQPNFVAAFHYNLRKSTGTKDMIKKAAARNIFIWLLPSEWNYDLDVYDIWSY